MSDKPAARLAYEDGTTAVIERLNRIKMDLLTAHDSASQRNPSDWCYAGDLEYVSIKLGEIVEHLEGSNE